MASCCKHRLLLPRASCPELSYCWPRLLLPRAVATQSYGRAVEGNLLLLLPRAKPLLAQAEASTGCCCCCPEQAAADTGYCCCCPELICPELLMASCCCPEFGYCWCRLCCPELLMASCCCPERWHRLLLPRAAVSAPSYELS